MLIQYDPEKFISESSMTVCSYHQDHPGANYAGCTCFGSYSVRARTESESVVGDSPEPLFGTNIRQAIHLIRSWRQR